MRRLLTFILRWSGLLVVPGGVLWALSPVGVSLSDSLFHTPNVFWKLFPSAPLLILLGLVGLQLRQAGRSELLEKVGFFLAALGLVLIVAGDVGLYWLGIDDDYIMTAPAYRAFRLRPEPGDTPPEESYVLQGAGRPELSDSSAFASPN